MGNENRRPDFDESNWQVLSTIGVKTILKNKLTFSLLDLYQTEERNQLPWSKTAQEIFEWRKNTNVQEHLPLLYHYELHRPILSSHQRHKVFTEHIIRLTELPPISKQQAFLILEQVVEVLPTLYKQFGLFHVNVYTVGVSESGSTKVWLNQNLAKNYAEEEDVIKNPSKNLQLAIVNNLVRMLRGKVYNNEIRPEYPFSLNFLETLRFVRETRQRNPEYAVGKVFLNRGEFNEFCKGSLAQRGAEGNLASLVGLNQIVQVSKQEQVGRVEIEGGDAQIGRRKVSTPNKQAGEGVKTQFSQGAPQFQLQQLQPQPTHQYAPPSPFGFNHIQPHFPSFTKPNNQQFHYYPPNFNSPPPIYLPSAPLSNNQQPSYRNDQRQFRPAFNHTMPTPLDPRQRQLEESIYLTPNPPFIQPQQRPFPSPNQQDRRNITPPKFLQRINADNQRQTSPKKERRNTQELPGGNRSISLSPTKRRDSKPPLPPPIPNISIDQQNGMRPFSINKLVTRRELSRIIEQEETKYDSFYLRNPVKKMEEEGFNVQLVQSIYVKTNETDQAP